MPDFSDPLTLAVACLNSQGIKLNGDDTKAGGLLQNNDLFNMALTVGRDEEGLLVFKEMDPH